MKELLLNNIDKIHTTEMGVKRIKENLELDTNNVVDWCITKIRNKNSKIKEIGKNWYIEIDDCIITVNRHSYTIITVHKK